MPETDALTDEFISVVKSKTLREKTAINAFLTGMSLQQELDKAEDED